MTNFITHIHSHIRNALATRRGSFLRPDKVPTGIHKEYPRMLTVTLPHIENITMPLHESLQKRASCSLNLTNRSLTLNELGILLGNSLGMRDEIHRKYPSGGALYPVETYLIGNIIEGYPSGVFHYHPKNHTLEFL